MAEATPRGDRISGRGVAWAIVAFNIILAELLLLPGLQRDNSLSEAARAWAIGAVILHAFLGSLAAIYAIASPFWEEEAADDQSGIERPSPPRPVRYYVVRVAVVVLVLNAAYVFLGAVTADSWNSSEWIALTAGGVGFAGVAIYAAATSARRYRRMGLEEKAAREARRRAGRGGNAGAFTWRDLLLFFGFGMVAVSGITIEEAREQNLGLVRALSSWVTLLIALIPVAGTAIAVNAVLRWAGGLPMDPLDPPLRSVDSEDEAQN